MSQKSQAFYCFTIFLLATGETSGEAIGETIGESFYQIEADKNQIEDLAGAINIHKKEKKKNKRQKTSSSFDDQLPVFDAGKAECSQAIDDNIALEQLNEGKF